MSDLTISPWETYTTLDVKDFATTDRDKALDQADIPSENDPGWKEMEALPNGQYGFDTKSVVQGLNKQLHFTYMQTTVTVPQGMELKSCLVTIGYVDDGVRVFLYNDEFPKGIKKSQAVKGDGIKSKDLVGSIKVGENRIVVVQYDWGGANRLSNLQIEANGNPVKPTELKTPDKYLGLWKHEDDYRRRGDATLVLSITDQGNGQMAAEYPGRPYFSYRPAFDTAAATPDHFEAKFKLVYWDGAGPSDYVSPYTIKYQLARRGEVLEGTYAPSWKAPRQVTLVRATEQDIP